ncbi:hypothetical protein C0J52_17311 [Blattella germanica]|nr:hypothetical protein C0J52_17311 [Blattella germanica]
MWMEPNKSYRSSFRKESSTDFDMDPGEDKQKKLFFKYSEADFEMCYRSSTDR